MSKIIGHFEFRLTDRGNLIGEFTYYHLDRISTHGANRILNNGNDDQHGFIGMYDFIWLEGQAPQFSILTINQTNGIFALIWKENNNTIYTGQAYLSEDKLIGSYTDIRDI